MGILDILFPKECLSCKKLGSYLCSDCISLQPIVKGRCIVCEKPAIDGVTHPRCSSSYSIDRLICLWEYSGGIRKAILSLKYKFAESISDELATHCASILSEYQARIKGDTFTFVPIPMHWYRQHWRGFNQVQEIGGKVSATLGVTYLPHILVRTVNRQSQASLDMKKRKENIKGVFMVNPKYRSLLLSGHTTWILFDDVYTTGSTVKEAGKVLKKAGAKQVWAVTISR